ncbi:hypothetical protein M8J75_008267 [Diaphorina citri]|nr:hypothetical protein M8J75_008267 [Diaphorina citri]
MRIHGKDRPFSCLLCNNTFAQLSTLLNHERIHDNHKPYKCTKCNYSARVLSNKLAHERIYHQDNVFKCHINNCIFSTKFYSCLRRHRKIFHSNESYYYRKNLNYFLQKYNISDFWSKCKVYEQV